MEYHAVHMSEALCSNVVRAEGLIGDLIVLGGLS